MLDPMKVTVLRIQCTLYRVTTSHLSFYPLIPLFNITLYRGHVLILHPTMMDKPSGHTHRSYMCVSPHSSTILRSEEHGSTGEEDFWGVWRWCEATFLRLLGQSRGGGKEPVNFSVPSPVASSRIFFASCVYGS